MSERIRRLIALALALVMLLPVLTGCGNTDKTPETTKPAPTEPEEEAKVLKILTLGHSLTVDSCHMLNMVAAAEGYEHLLVGTLYYSGCSLERHVQYLSSDEPAYNFYLSSTETPTVAPVITDGVTMKYGLTYEYWDIIIMQGGGMEVAKSDTYTDGNIQIIQNYVNQHKLNPLAKFAWHMPWALPVDTDLQQTQKTGTVHQAYAKYDHDRSKYFAAMTKCVSDHIMTDETFEILIPTGTGVENALSSYKTEKDLHRDYAHGTDFSCLIAAYIYFCSVTGIDHLDEIKVDVVQPQFFRRPNGMPKWELTEDEKALILESVNNALKNPLEMTQSQFTQQPAA